MNYQHIKGFYMLILMFMVGLCLFVISRQSPVILKAPGFFKHNYDRYVQPNLTHESVSTTAGVKTILYWNRWWAIRSYFGTGSKPFEGCSEKRCEFTYDRSLMNSSDALIIHLPTIRSPHEMPQHRKANQIYIHFLTDSPRIVREKLKKYNHMFNATWTNRKDADFPMPWGTFVPLSDDQRQHVKYTFPTVEETKKKKLVALVTSHCNTTSGREWVTAAMKQYIPVDVFGTCGKYTCPKSQNPNCIMDIYKKYKFYLAFENSLCQDYITEKLWRTLTADIVPIVLGGGDYKKDTPPYSYINVHDFPSIKALTDYLLILDKNISLYNEYFKWKLKYAVKGRLVIKPAVCKLCSYLHTDFNTLKASRQDALSKFGPASSCKDRSSFLGHIKDIPWPIK